MSIRLDKIQHYRMRAQELRSQASKNVQAREVLLSIAESYEQLAGELEAYFSARGRAS